MLLAQKGLAGKICMITFSLQHLSLVSEALAQFEPVEKMTEKNGRVFPYIGYEFDGETFYSVEYRGTATQQEYDDFKD